MDLSHFEKMDSVMLMSIINMKLRDQFDGDLDELVRFFDLDKKKLEDKLATAGFEFLTAAKQFR